MESIDLSLEKTPENVFRAVAANSKVNSTHFSVPLSPNGLSSTLPAVSNRSPSNTNRIAPGCHGPPYFVLSHAPPSQASAAGRPQSFSPVGAAGSGDGIGQAGGISRAKDSGGVRKADESANTTIMDTLYGGVGLV